jgi:hypothetical protein
LRSWCENQNTKSHRTLPFKYSMGVWLAINSSLFEDRFIPPAQCATESITIINSFKQSKAEKLPRQTIAEDKVLPSIKSVGQGEFSISKTSIL